MYQLRYFFPSLMVGLGFLFSCSTPPASVAQQTLLPIPSQTNSVQASSSFTNPSALEDLATAVTVRIFSEKDNILSGGSGVLMQQQGEQYLVLTNQHVVAEAGERTYQVQTHDGAIHQARVLELPDTEHYEDVSFVVFQSPKRYQLVSYTRHGSPVEPNQTIIAVGFPFIDQLTQSQELTVTTGRIVRVLDRPLVGGYQLGYDNAITPGMSGGPILNHQGELVGINGLRSNPLFSNSYIYEDGTPVAPGELEAVRQLSWAVPLKTATELLEATEASF
jgi:S1-C subfamily serine protease